jgi:tRNA synthetases class I (E and Q), catalytic domain/Anticodon binding domain
MKVRFAPSPTGSLHIGNALGAVANRNEARAQVATILDAPAARSIIRELKAVGGNLRAVRRALMGREAGPELWSVIAALPREETLRRIDGAL